MRAALNALIQTAADVGTRAVTVICSNHSFLRRGRDANSPRLVALATDIERVPKTCFRSNLIPLPRRPFLLVSIGRPSIVPPRKRALQIGMSARSGPLLMNLKQTASRPVRRAGATASLAL